MAKAQIPFLIALEKNDNQYNAGYGNYYGVTYSPQKTLAMRGLIERLAFEQSIYSKDVIEAVITRLTKVMCELLSSGESVKWDGLGTFSPFVESDGVDSIAQFDVNTHVKGVHIRFIPENEKGQKLTSRAFRDLCTLQLAGVWDKQKIVVNGKEQVLRTFYTLDEWNARNV